MMRVARGRLRQRQPHLGRPGALAGRQRRRARGRRHRHGRPGYGRRRRPGRAAGARRVRRLRCGPGRHQRHARGDRPGRGRRPAVPGYLRRHAADGATRPRTHHHRRVRLGARRRCPDGPTPACGCRRWAGTGSTSHPARTSCWPASNPATTPTSCTPTPCKAPRRPTSSPPPTTAATVVAMVANGSRAGTQFHVEKSQATGLRIPRQLPAVDAVNNMAPVTTPALLVERPRS